MLKASEKLLIAEELLDIVEYQVIRKLKVKNPSITSEQIEVELRKWYASGLAGPGEPVNIKKRFNESI